MVTVLKIAYRNTGRQGRRTFLLAGAIAFGVMVITMLNAFTAGMVENVRNNFSLVFGGHIYITGSELLPSGRVINTIGDDGIVQAELDNVERFVQQVNKRSMAMGELIFGTQRSSERIDGVEWSAEKGLPDSLTVIHGSLAELADPRAAILPEPVAERLGVAVGETLLFRVETVTGQQNLGEFRVIAVIEDQSSFGLSTTYARRAYLNELIGLESGAYQMLHIFLHDMRDMDFVSDKIHEALAAKAAVEPRTRLNFHAGMDGGGDEDEGEMPVAALFGGAGKPKEPWTGTKFAVANLNDIMAPVMSMVGVLDAVSLGVFVILLLIIMVGIMNTFRMIMIERTQEIGTMRAFGMQGRAVRRIFLAEALIIGIGGALAGLAVGGVVLFALSMIRFDSASPLQFFLRDGHFSFRLLPASMLSNLLIVMLFTLLAAYLPARAASRLRPAEALRAHS